MSQRCLWTFCQAKGAELKRYAVLEIILHTKLDIEHHGKDIEAVRRLLRGTSHVAAHGHRTVTVVTLSSETSEELMDRLRPVLSDRFKNAWIATAPTDIVALHGDIDPRQTRILEFYSRLRDGLDTKYVGEIERRPQRFFRPVKDGPSRAPIQVHRKAQPKWRPPQDPNRPKR